MRHIVIGTAGHIDHGKSTLVQALTGIDPDRLKEEKARGITIDLGFAHCQIGETRVAFVDVPGHERFVRNMLAGATGIDAVLLVVSADESVMPQTREHFAICRLLDVRAGVVALTKCDAGAAGAAGAVGAAGAPGADAEMIGVARAEVTEMVAGSFLEDAPIVEVSAKTGHGLDALRDALVRVAASAPAREADGPMRLPIDRVFSMKGFGAVITGTLVSGCLRVDDEVDLLPSGRRVRVRGLQVHGERVREAGSGQRVAANLDDVETADITRGDLLATPDAFTLTSVCDVVLELLADTKPLTHGTRVRVHHGTREALARVGLVETTAAPGSRSYARLRLEAPMVMTRGDRFVLRAYSPVITIGGGSVLDPHPPRSALRTAAARERFAALDQPSAERAALVMLEESGREGLPVAALTSRLGLRGRAVHATAEQLAPPEGAQLSQAVGPTANPATSGGRPTQPELTRHAGGTTQSELPPHAGGATEPGSARTTGATSPASSANGATPSELTAHAGGATEPGSARTAGATSPASSAGGATPSGLAAHAGGATEPGSARTTGATSPASSAGGATPSELAAHAGGATEPGSARTAGASADAAPRRRYKAVRIGDRLVSRDVLDRLSTGLMQQVARHHQAQPDSDGLPREEARDRLGVSARVFEFLLAELAAAGTLVVRERLALPSHRVAVPDADAAVLARVEEAVLAAGLRPPELSELAGSLKLAPATLDRLVGLLVRQKRLIKLGTLLFHPDVLARLRDETRALKADAPAGRAIVNVASFKTRYDVSRKYAIPLLEYLDRERVTRRVGDERVVL